VNAISEKKRGKTSGCLAILGIKTDPPHRGDYQGILQAASKAVLGRMGEDRPRKRLTVQNTNRIRNL